MSKLPDDKRFTDFSDYGRPLAQTLVQALSHTTCTSIHLTFAFFVAGLLSIACIFLHQFVLAAIFLLVKNVLDAADGEMAREKNHPSYTGRYLDSVFDFVINLGVFAALYVVTGAPALVFVFAFLGLQFQCSVCNFYYVIQRNRVNGDATSRIVEHSKPIAFPYENQAVVDWLHTMFVCLYSPFDLLVLWLDKKAIRVREFPKWFLSLSSTLLLGFQLALIAAFLLLGRADWVLPFFAIYSVWGLLVVLVRKVAVGNG